jgi:hypothetical protein
MIIYSNHDNETTYKKQQKIVFPSAKNAQHFGTESE